MLSYTFRKDLIQKEATYQLDNEKLTIIPIEGSTETLFLKDIKEVHQIFAPTRYVKNQYATILDFTSGRKITIRNTHFKGWANFEDKSREYVNFVHFLHNSMYLYNPGAVFRGGLTQMAYTWRLIFYIFIALIVLGLAALLIFAYVWIALLHIIMLLFWIPLVLKDIKLNKPVIYQPNHIPEHLLPEVKGK